MAGPAFAPAYEPVTDGDGTLAAGEADGSLCAGVGKADGVGAALPVVAGVLMIGGMGAVWGTDGVEVNG
jgi:hypothetical protein